MLPNGSGGRHRNASDQHDDTLERSADEHRAGDEHVDRGAGVDDDQHYDDQHYDDQHYDDPATAPTVAAARVR